MIELSSGWLRSPLSLSEEAVLQALKTLPPEYEVLPGSRLEIPAVSGGESAIMYEPDFEIAGPGGRRLVIEVKTSKSLSMPNLARFLKVNELIHAAGKGFLVLVWGADRVRAGPSSMPEFEALHIQVVQTDSDVLHAIKNEFLRSRNSGRN